MTARLRALLVIAGMLVVASSAHAQWTRVLELPASQMYSVWTKGDTITAGDDTLAYVSTNGGATWKRSVRITTGTATVEVVRMHKGKLYAGTFGQGVFVSDNLGDSWTAFNQGLTGGIANSHLFISDMLVRGESLFVATSGAGPYIRNLAAAGTWSHYGNVFEPNQSSNMNAITASPTRLFACAGANGTAFFRDPNQPDWTLTWLNNIGIVPGLGALTAIWTGTRWVVGSNIGVFHSVLGQSPWTFSDVGLGTLFNVGFAMRGSTVFACFGTGGGSTFAFSMDHGASWWPIETLPGTFTFRIATHGNTLYAARFDGLWRRSIATVDAPPTPAPSRLQFALVGPNPVRDEVHFQFDLPETGPAAIDVFDVRGRRVARVVESRPAGTNQLQWSARGLARGVYVARLTAGDESATARFVRVD